MFNLDHFKRLLAASGRLRLGVADTFRFLWSYYGCKLPGAAARASVPIEITLGSEARPVRLAIRPNGFDYDVVEELFARRVYDVGLTGVRSVLDLGANIGVASAFFGTLFPEARFACVEPVPDNVSLLHRNAALNHLSVEIFAAAAGAADGQIEMEISSDPRQSAAMEKHFTPLSGQRVTVPLLSVPTILKKLGWSAVDLLKVDIEGGEVQLFAGNPPWLAAVGAIIGEGHLGFGYDIDRAHADLAPAGFRVTLLEQRAGSFLFLAIRDAA
jgi:FkbM family methyltransferase